MYCSAIIPSIPTICYLLVCRCLTTCKRCLRPLVGSENLSFVTLLPFLLLLLDESVFDTQAGEVGVVISFLTIVHLGCALHYHLERWKTTEPDLRRYEKYDNEIWDLKERKDFQTHPPNPKKCSLIFIISKYRDLLWFKFLLEVLDISSTWALASMHIPKWLDGRMDGWMEHYLFLLLWPSLLCGLLY